MRVLVCAGGTGGGIYPALTAVAALHEFGVEREQILWVGIQGEMEEELVPRAGLTLTTIQGGPIVGVSLGTRVKNLSKLTWSIGSANRLIRQFRPDVALLTGGYMAAPVAVASRLQRVPIVIFLPDVEPGSAIKAITPLAQKVACATELSRPYIPEAKMVVTGYPVRPEILAATQLSKEEALAQFELTAERPTLFVFGGSRGAWNINKALLENLPRLLAEVQIIHISGTKTWPEIAAYAETLPADLRQWYRPYPYLHEQMGAAFRAADLALARAGASMMGECPAFGLPAILVPLTFAWRYQKVNADYLSERGAAIQSTDERLSQELTALVLDLFADSPRLRAMQEAARALARPEAAHRLAQIIQQTARQPRQGVAA
jgi:UDP-N-acetylglucosamine--N-acetylmuramyl-(pentapeptide) pyrophosphoryl-undecaprenol N-acetylglucosamine transferase